MANNNKKMVEYKIKLDLLVDEHTGNLVCCQAESDFVDTILSFLLVPMGALIREAEKVSEIGCMDNLYRSVEKFEERFWYTKACKTMLLKPRMDITAAYLADKQTYKIGNEAREYYECTSCSKTSGSEVLLSLFPDECNRNCKGQRISRDKCHYENPSPGFLREQRKFVITNDLKVSLKSSELSQNTKVVPKSIGRDELLHLFNRSFLSNAPMADIFSLKEHPMETSEQLGQMTRTTQLQTPSEEESKKFKLELCISGLTNKVAYAMCDTDFEDFLFSFLTLPVGSIIKLFGGHSSMGCLDNLYQSVEKQFSSNHKLLPKDTEDILLNPRICYMWGIKNQLFEVSEGEADNLGVVDGGDQKLATFMDPKSRKTTETGGGFALERRKYIIMDDLKIMPRDTVETECYDSLTCADRKNDYYVVIPSHPIFTEASVGKSEALEILKAALTSGRVLTKVFCKKRKRVGWSRFHSPSSSCSDPS